MRKPIRYSSLLMCMFFITSCAKNSIKESNNNVTVKASQFEGSWFGHGKNTFGADQTWTLNMREVSTNEIKINGRFDVTGRESHPVNYYGKITGNVLEWTGGGNSDCAAMLVNQDKMNFECNGFGSIEVEMHRDLSYDKTRINNDPSISAQYPSSLSSIPITNSINTTGGNCHTDLSYLSSRIPSFSLPALNDVRSAILSENLHNTMRAAKQQGYSAESAIQATLEQARAYDDTVRQALRTAAATDGFGTTDDEFLDSLKRGTLRVSTCDGIRNAALCDAINNKLGAIASRATAADMQCHLRAGTWSN